MLTMAGSIVNLHPNCGYFIRTTRVGGQNIKNLRVHSVVKLQ